MSITLLHLIPKDPHFSPASAASEAAQDRLQQLIPEALGGYDVWDIPGTAFIDPGENWCGVRCPVCGSDIEDWWGDAMDTATLPDGYFDALAVTMQTLPVRVSERSTSDDHADEIRPCRGRVPQAPRPHRDVRRLPRRYAVLHGCPARPRRAGGSPMMCDRCDQPIDPADASHTRFPGRPAPASRSSYAGSAATCCRRSARKRTRTRLAADLPPVPGRRRPGARRARSSSVSWASRSCVPVARLLALAFRWFPRDVAAAERLSFGHSWPLPGALGRAPTAPSEARAPLQEFDRTDVAPGSARTRPPCRIGQGCYSLSSCQRRMSDAPAVECGCGGGPWPCVPSWRADPERQP